MINKSTKEFEIIDNFLADIQQAIFDIDYTNIKLSSNFENIIGKISDLVDELNNELYYQQEKNNKESEK